jgi:IS30 family transposase
MMAELNARQRAERSIRKPMITSELTNAIAEGYAHHWSPEQIAHGNIGVTVCYNTIYNWIYKSLVPAVDRNQIKHRKKHSKRQKESLSESSRKMTKSRGID